MKLRFRGNLEQIPLGTEQLLGALDGIVPRDMLRPGDDPGMHLYMAGARDLVDWLIQRFEWDRNPQEKVEEAWYDGDEELRQFIEDPE